MIDLVNLPQKPGCYLFKDKSSKVIYVGKAKNIKKRVNSYFVNKNIDQKTKQLVLYTKFIDFFVTDNEVEALILENNLIKKHYPKYNINLKDSKRYAYLKITNEEFPRLILERQRKDNGEYFGPFVSAEVRDYIKELLNKNFMIRTCKTLRKRACLRYHIKLCRAPCIQKISKTKYNEEINKVRQVLRGDYKNLVKSLENDMRKFSDKLNFEKAQIIKNQIDSIAYLTDKQKVERSKKYDEDIINYVIKNNVVYLLLFNVKNGILENKHEFEFEKKDNFFEEFLIQYYSSNYCPVEIIINEKIDNSLIQFLKLKGIKRVVIPKQGEKKDLLRLVKKNIELSYFANEKKLKELQTKLQLNEIPSVIECFDISHLSGTAMVASMVQFRDGKPDKQNYRRFKIKSVSSIDDTSCINEVVYRRYKRLKNEYAIMPNLIVIDGGRGQLNAAIDSLRTLNLKLPVIALAKKLEEIYVPGLKKTIKLNEKSDALKLLQSIRNEAHRFAINYNRLLRRKKAFE
jgi:excinuclease ABC subunit C